MHGSCISELSEFSTATSMVHKPNNWQNQFEWYLHAWNLCYFRSLLDSSSHCTVWKQNWMFSSCWVIFFTTNRKRKKRSSSVGQYEAPFINCLPSYLCQLNISHLKHGVLDSRQALLLRIERHRRPGETIQRKWMVHKSFYTGGFGQSSFCW